MLLPCTDALRSSLRWRSPKTIATLRTVLPRPLWHWAPGVTARAVDGDAPLVVDGAPATPTPPPVQPLVVDGNLATPAQPLQSLEDMQVFVERTKAQEEDIRRKREEVELQLLRLRKQEAVRRQQAIKLKLATQKADAAIVQQMSTSAAGAQQPDSPAGAAPLTPLPAAAQQKRKVVLKKSKRMQSVAAAAGLHRLPQSTTPPPTQVSRPQTTASSPAVALVSRESLIEARHAQQGAGPGAESGGESSDSEMCQDVVVPKPIFIISDCTGESAARTVRAALAQFEARCRTSAPAQIMVFRFVESTDKITQIVKEAAAEDALLVFTLVDPRMVEAVQKACGLYSVKYVDLWSTLLDRMEDHLSAVRSGIPASQLPDRKPKGNLTEEYFKMIEAVEYTRKMDDGARPEEWKNADLLILGVSRCGKTPLSIYLGQRGYKVANLPLVPGVPIPRELFDMDQTRIVGLTIDPQVLATIRRNRIMMMGVTNAAPIDYAELAKITRELDWAMELYRANPTWPVLDVTFRGIEETAARILKLLNDRRGYASPQWVEALHRKEAAAQARARAIQTAPLSAAAPSTSSAAPAPAADPPPTTAQAPAGPPPPTPAPVPAGTSKALTLQSSELIYAGDSSYLMQGLY